MHEQNMQQASIKTVGAALEELLHGLGLDKKLHEYDAVVFWEHVVGKQIARMSTATKISNGTLIVRVKTSVWRNELTLRKKEIVQRLNEYLGSEIVSDITFQ